MSMSCSHSQSFEGRDDYVCPSCKGKLELKEQTFVCLACQVSYPIINGIPDFVLEDLTESPDPIFRRVRTFDMLAAVYESWFWYPLFLNLVGGLGSMSRKELVRNVAEIVRMDEGTILDVACGPGTLSRHAASPSVFVHGIDISMGMLRKGVAYSKRDHIRNLQFARAKVEELPFRDAVFDAAICGGALHLFRDTVWTLREIGRTMKKGAPLAVTTLIAGNKGILRSRQIRRHAQQHHGTHIFEIHKLEQYLSEAGFEGFEPKVCGSLLLFRTQKAGGPRYGKEDEL